MRFAELRSIELRFAELRFFELRFAELRLIKLRFAEYDGPCRSIVEYADRNEMIKINLR